MLTSPTCCFRLFAQEVEKARILNLRLGIGIGMFQGMANIALNGKIYKYYWLLVVFMSLSRILPSGSCSVMCSLITGELKMSCRTEVGVRTSGCGVPHLTLCI